MTIFSTDADTEPTYIDLIDISAGYGVMSALIEDLLPGDVVQMVALEVSPQAGGASVLNLEVDMVQRTSGFYSWVSSSAIYAHFTLTAANVATIAAGEFVYSVVVSVLRNGVTLTREVQAGLLAARTAPSPTPPLIVANIVLTGGPVTGGIGDTAQLVAVAYDGLGNIIPTADIEWSSGDPLVAQPDQGGLVSFLTPGVTTIYAESMGIQASTTATSNDPAFVAPSDRQVAGWLDLDHSWQPRSLDASWIAAGTFPGNSGSAFAFPGPVTALSFGGDGSLLTNLSPAALSGPVAVNKGGTGVASLAAGNLALGAGTSPFTALAPGAAGGYVRSNGTAWARALPVVADISDIATAATGITKVGTINTGVWQGSSIATGFTDAKIKTVTGTLNRLTVAGTATDPTFDISASYAGQASLTTLGTIATGVWQGTSIATTYTDAKVASVAGTLNRVTISGTGSAPVVDIAAGYVGQTSITTLGTISAGTWQGNVIGTTYTSAQIISVGGTSARITIGGTSTQPVVDISATYVGQASLTTLGTITTGTWQGTAIADTYLAALSVSKLTGTTLPVSIVNSSLTTVGTIATGTWQATAIANAYIATGLDVAKLTAGTVLPSNVITSSLTTVGTIGAGTWQGTAIANTYIASGLDVAKLTVGTTIPSNVVTSSLTTVGTIGAGTWQGTLISPTFGGTGVSNVGKTITLGGNLTTSGAFTTTLTVTANTSVTLPTTGTLVNTAVTTLSSLVSVATITTGVWNATPIANAYVATGLDVTKLTVGATLPSNVTGSSLTSVGTIAAGVWQGTDIDTAYTVAQIVTVTGTSNRITIGGTGTAPIFDIAATYVGQASITTLGTVTTGTWAATAIGTTKGGTGLTSYALGDIIYASNTNVLLQLAGNTVATKKYLSQTGTGSVSAAPAWTSIVAADISDLASATTGITSVGTLTVGVWHAGVIDGQYGGTGVNNAGKTITLGGSFTTSGSFTTTLTLTGNTNVTLPTSGTLVNTAVTTLSSLTTVGILASTHLTSPVVDSGGLRVTTGGVSLGSLSLAGSAIYISGSPWAGTNANEFGIANNPTFDNAATNSGSVFSTGPSTAAASFTMPDLYHFRVQDVSIGAGSVVTRQYGLYVPNLVNATTNYAIYTNTGLVRFGDATTIAAGGLFVTNVANASDIVLTGSPTSVRQIQLGNSSNFGAIGTNFSSGVVSISYNASQTTNATDNWAQSSAGIASSQLRVSAGGLNLYSAAAGTASGIAATFWGSSVMLIDNAGNATFSGSITSTTGNLSLPSGTIGIGVSAISQQGIRMSGIVLTGATTQVGAAIFPTFGSGATAAGRCIQTAVITTPAAFTMVNGYAWYAQRASLGAGSAVTNMYGLYMEDVVDGGTLNYAIYTNAGQVRFGDDVTIADTLTVQGTTINMAGGSTIGTTTVSGFSLKINGSSIWTITTGGHFTAATDNTNDLGSATNRPRDLFLGRNATIGGLLTTAASATGGAGARFPHGTAPTSPVNGDFWTTTAGAFVRINGVTKTFTLT